MSKKSFTESLSNSFKARDVETVSEQTKTTDTTDKTDKPVSHSSGSEAVSTETTKKNHKPKKTMTPITRETKGARVSWQFKESLIEKVRKAADINNVSVQEFVARILEENIDDYL